MKEYKVKVPYTYYDDMKQFDDEVTYEIFAKAGEQARHRAKKYVRSVGTVQSVGSTELLEVNDV